jgi:HEPN domain-containing protein
VREYKDSLLPEDWQRVARKDWERMNLHLSVDDAEAAGYFLQQSLEKYLKAFLLQHGWQLRKIHALHDLLSSAIRYNPDLEEFRKLCERVSGYYLADRYPPFTPSELTCSDIQKDIEGAKRLIKALSGEDQ